MVRVVVVGGVRWRIARVLTLARARTLSLACSCGVDESKPMTCGAYGLMLYPNCGCCMKAGVLHPDKVEALGKKADWIVCNGCCIPGIFNTADYCLVPYTCCASEMTMYCCIVQDCNFPCSDDVPIMLTLFLPGLMVYPKCGCCLKVEDAMGPPAHAVHPQGAAPPQVMMPQMLVAPAGMFPVTVPVGAVPGMAVQVQSPTGQMVQVTIPAGAVPGSVFMVPQPMMQQVMMVPVAQGAPPAPEATTGLDAPTPHEMARGSDGSASEVLQKPMPV